MKELFKLVNSQGKEFRNFLNSLFLFVRELNARTDEKANSENQEHLFRLGHSLAENLV